MTATALVKYEAARAALQAAHDVDEVKDIRDKAQAMAAYAKQAKDTKLVEWASEIKVRAERRAGELLSKIDRKNGDKGAEGIRSTLEQIEVPVVTAHRWQKIAAIPEEKFEKAIAETKESAGVVTTAAVLRAAKPKSKSEPRAEPKPTTPKAKPFDKEAAHTRAELIDLQGKYADLTEKHSDLADTARELQDKLTAFETTEPDEQQKEIMKLQKRIVRLEAEVERITRARNDLQNKCNELIRQVKLERKKNGG